MGNSNNEAGKCGYKSGILPECAPLAMSYTPMQQSSEPAYDSNDALARGTLFPGLDLPFMNKINKTPGTPTPLFELQALSFVADELGLYLDTHSEDTEAFATYQECLKMLEEGKKRYVELYGPITKADLISAKSYTWLESPWPWEYKAGMEG